MLTQALRTFSLVGLIVVAHTIKPFSLGNVTAFAHQTFYSFSFLLPEQTVEHLERAGELAALLGGWGDQSNLTERLTEKLIAFKSDVSPAEAHQWVALKAKTVNQRAGGAGKTVRRFERPARSLQAHHQASLGAAPLPIIPGIEASLIPSVTLMALPPLPLTARTSAQDLQEGVRVQPNSFNTDCEWRSAYEKQTTIPAEILLKLQEAQIPSQKIKLRGLNQRASSGQACPQAGKATGAGSGSSKQSC